MRVGLIPPKGLENLALRSKFHLALAIPELMNRRVYSGMYSRASELGDFVVLDNGIAEGQPCNSTDLRIYAKRLEAKELVAPDVIKNAKKTVELVKMFFEEPGLLPIKHMAVIQGKKVEEFKWCVEQFAEIPYVTTIGIPRHMLETLTSRACRIDMANWIADTFPDRFELHFLGTNPKWLGEVKSASKYCSHVRSVDTSMPFSYAIAGEELATTKEEIIRPKFYFDRDWSRMVRSDLVLRNITTLLEWADASGVRSDANTTRAQTSLSKV